MAPVVSGHWGRLLYRPGGCEFRGSTDRSLLTLKKAAEHLIFRRTFSMFEDNWSLFSQAFQVTGIVTILTNVFAFMSGDT